ncbi:MAG: aminotransferase class I/II-fold pyridoxal phosphate-dependent enzyme, partial [Thermoplasmata archaeon]
MGISYPEERTEITLDSNENLLMPERYYEEIKDEMDFEFRNYPSPTAKELKRNIADHYGLSEEQVTVGNGSDAILDTIVKSFSTGEHVLGYFTPSYEMYPFFSSRNQRKSIEIPLNGDFSLPSLDNYLEVVDVLIICSPNNPSGITVDRKKIESILEDIKKNKAEVF